MNIYYLKHQKLLRKLTYFYLPFKKINYSPTVTSNLIKIFYDIESICVRNHILRLSSTNE
jgi:hypothetical protein